LKSLKSSVNTISSDIEARSWLYQKTDRTNKLIIHNKESISKGLTLISSIIEDDTISLKVIDINGSIVHSWDVDWFKVWPNATHLSEKDLPKSRPGTQIHGMVLLENGDVIYNYATLGLVRLDVCGNVIWRLPYRTHHSIYRDEYDNIWVPGQKNHEEPLSGFPTFKPPFLEPTVLKISLEGDQSHLVEANAKLAKRRNMTVEMLNSIDGISCVKPEGAFYAFPQLHGIESDAHFVAELIKATGVVVVPGSGFGQVPGTNHFRVVFLPNEKILEKAYNSIGSFLKKYKQKYPKSVEV